MNRNLNGTSTPEPRDSISTQIVTPPRRSRTKPKKINKWVLIVGILLVLVSVDEFYQTRVAFTNEAAPVYSVASEDYASGGRCPAGTSLVSSESGCIQAAASLGLQYAYAVLWPDDPAGCLSCCGSKVYFNHLSATTGIHPGSNSICVSTPEGAAANDYFFNEDHHAGDPVEPSLDGHPPQDLLHKMFNQAQGADRVESGKKKVAFAVTVTKDGKFGDGAAVLAYGINKACRDADLDFDLVAIVAPNVTTGRQQLSRIGYRVLERTLPVEVNDIQGDHLRNRIVGSGCCGEWELLKLHMYTLLEYDRVLHLDMDSMVLQCPTELFQMDNVTGIYTYDYGMAKGNNHAFPPVQGGFILVKPDMAVYQEYVDIFREGDFRRGSGWGGSHVGNFWGGPTIQGVMSYYYNIYHPGNGMEVDRCIYNNMVDNDRCRNTSISDVKGMHFTICQKPWDCFLRHKHQLCRTFLQEWLKLREELEGSLGIPQTKACKSGGKKNYLPLNWDLDWSYGNI